MSPADQAIPGRIHRYGGFWARVAADFIDGVILLVPTQGSASTPATTTSSEGGATTGKAQIGLRVVTINGQRISFARATARHFGKYLSALTLMIGFITFLPVLW